MQYLTVFLGFFQHFSKLLGRRFPSIKIALKMPWYASKMLPRRSQDAPRGSQDALKTVQEAPKTLQRRSKSLPKRSQKLPHGFQEVPRGSQEASRGSKKPPRRSKRLPGGLKEGSKRLANASQERLNDSIFVKKLVDFPVELHPLKSKSSKTWTLLIRATRSKSIDR